MTVADRINETRQRLAEIARQQEETQRRSYELQREWGWQS